MKQPRKIAFVAQPIDGVLPPQQNSIGMWTYEVALRMARHCPVIVYTRGGRFRKRMLRIDGVEFRSIPTSFDGLLLRLCKLLPQSRDPKRPFFASRWFFLGYIVQIALDLRKQDCDIVHVFNFSQFASVLRAFNPAIKIVLNMRCEWLSQLDSSMIANRLKNIDLVIGCSEYITAKIYRRYPCYASRCTTVHNGVDVKAFARQNGNLPRKENDAKKLLYVGRVSPEKGVHILVDAFDKVIGQYPKLQLDIVGPPGQLPLEYFIALSDDQSANDLALYYCGKSRHSYASHLHDRIKSLKMSSRVTLHGSVPHMQLIRHYSDADIFIFPSVWEEPFGVPPIEAMATGLPVIATATGGLPEIIEHGRTGLIVQPNNVDMLAGAIVKLLDDEELRRDMGQAARQRAVEFFSFERVVSNLLAHYSDLCTKNENSDTQHFA